MRKLSLQYGKRGRLVKNENYLEIQFFYSKASKKRRMVSGDTVRKLNVVWSCSETRSSHFSDRIVLRYAFRITKEIKIFKNFSSPVGKVSCSLIISLIVWRIYLENFWLRCVALNQQEARFLTYFCRLFLLSISLKSLFCFIFPSYTLFVYCFAIFNRQRAPISALCIFTLNFQLQL